MKKTAHGLTIVDRFVSCGHTGGAEPKAVINLSGELCASQYEGQDRVARVEGPGAIAAVLSMQDAEALAHQLLDLAASLRGRVEARVT